jgi:hypothetical protein
LWLSSLQSQAHQKRFLDEELITFLVLKVLLVHPFREVKPFIIWFYIPWLDYDVTLSEVVELFVAIPTSPSSSKRESGRKSY